MASLVGSVFQEYSTLTASERNLAVNFIGSTLSYLNDFTVGDSVTAGTDENDLYFVNSNSDGSAKDFSDGGDDIIVSEKSIDLPKHIEAVILTGGDNLSVTGNALDNTIAGNDGDNLLEGGAGDDLILGGKGNDTLVGGAGEDSLYGGQGNDSITSNGGADLIDGGSGNDTLEGNAGRDTIYGGGGSDVIFGFGGDDSMIGGNGDDTIYGAAGDDLIEGGDDDDLLYGDAGKDTIVAGQGYDTMYGGAGDDVFYFGADGNDDGEAVIADFRPGRDIIEIESALDTVVNILDSVYTNGDGDTVVTIGDKEVVLLGIDEDDVDNSFFHIS